MSKFKEKCEALEAKIQSAYEEGITIEAAEKLAAEFLGAQLLVSSQLAKVGLDARMRKSGVKAIKAAIYLDIIQKNEKKPTEAQITALIDSDSLVKGEQESLDQAEVDCEELKRLFDVYSNSHIYFRNIGKGGM